jgi:hypothetical protein
MQEVDKIEEDENKDSPIPEIEDEPEEKDQDEELKESQEEEGADVGSEETNGE